MSDGYKKIGWWCPCYNHDTKFQATIQFGRDLAFSMVRGDEVIPWGTHSCDLVYSRNAALDKALHEGYDYLLMQDSDCYSPGPRGALEPLLELAEKSGATMTGACVTLRTRPPRANVWPCYPGEKYAAEKMGTGIVLINLNKVREWYDDYEGPCFYRTYKDAKCTVPDVGLDVFFCKVIKSHGGTLAVDASIPTVHVDRTHEHHYNGISAPDMADSMGNEGTEPQLGIV